MTYPLLDGGAVGTRLTSIRHKAGQKDDRGSPLALRPVHHACFLSVTAPQMIWPSYLCLVVDSSPRAQIWLSFLGSRKIYLLLEQFIDDHDSILVADLCIDKTRRSHFMEGSSSRCQAIAREATFATTVLMLEYPIRC